MEKRKSGILLHISSLPSKFAIGDFGQEAFRFIDTLKDARQSLWQILPLTPINKHNSPYQGNSAVALEPLFISIEKLKDEGLLTEDEISEFSEYRSINYNAARTIKEALFKKAYIRFKLNAKTDDYLEFLNENDWLIEYGLFISLLRYFEVEDWMNLPPELKNRDNEFLSVFRDKLKDEIDYITFLQHRAFKHLTELKDYAAKVGIEIIGDLPFYVAHNSMDVWINREMFNLSEDASLKTKAGVPPDYFSKDGQDWSNPTYNIDYIVQNNYSWWIKRITNSLKYLDFLRLDHFIGFERYFEIPYDKKPIDGSWKRSLGIEFFNELKKYISIDRLIAEDLGDVFDDVRSLKEECNLAGMKVLQFAFLNNEDNPHLPCNYEVNCVVYSATHDNTTSQSWYENAGERESDFFRKYANVSGEDASWDMIRLALSSVSKFAIIPLQDILILDDSRRMNRPGTVNNNWEFSFEWDEIKDYHLEGLRYLSKLYNRN